VDCELDLTHNFINLSCLF